MTVDNISDNISDVISNIFRNIITEIVMKHKEHKLYEKTLRSDLLPALGCTEPGAVGYAAAKAASCGR